MLEMTHTMDAMKQIFLQMTGYVKAAVASAEWALLSLIARFLCFSYSIYWSESGPLGGLLFWEYIYLYLFLNKYRQIFYY